MGYPTLAVLTADVRDDALSTREGAGTVTNLLYTMGAALTDGQGAAVVGGTNLLKVGSVYHLWAAGDLTATSAAPPTFTFDAQIGGAAVGLAIAFSALTALLSSDIPWEFEAWLTVRAVGAGATSIQGFSKAAINLATPVTGRATALATGLSSTGIVSFGMTTKWGTATTGNASQCREAVIESLHA